MTSGNKKNYIVVIILLVAVIGLGYLGLAGKQADPNFPDGVVKEVQALGALGERVSLAGPCFTEYQFESAGRSGGKAQVYALTIGVSKNVSDDMELIEFFADNDCQDEAQSIDGQVTKAFTESDKKGSVEVYYKTPSGRRIIMPW